MFVLLMDKMADQNSPGYQPRKFIDMGYVKVLSFQHVKCLHFVTVAVMLLQLIYYNAILLYNSIGFVFISHYILPIKVN